MNVNHNINNNTTANDSRRRQHPHSSLLTRSSNVIAKIINNLFRNKYGLLFLNILLLIFMFTFRNGIGGDGDGSEYNDYNNNNNNNIRSSSSLSLSASAAAAAATSAEGVKSDLPCVPVTTTTATTATATESTNDDDDATTTATATDKNNKNNKVNNNDENTHKTATVMAMATNYGLTDYQKFVGSLRKTGFGGNIILAVAPNLPLEEEIYLKSKNVIIKKVEYVKCSNPANPNLIKDNIKLDEIENHHDRELVTCIKPYPKLKHRWARFPLLRDYLLECDNHPKPEIQCGGPVLVTDLADTIFQRNPFGIDAPYVDGLQVFEEFHTIRTTNWLTDWPIGDCKGVHYDEPMLCSGTTVGTRLAIIDYLNIMEYEMNIWMSSSVCCCFQTNGDDQSIHNYIYYNHQLDIVHGGVKAIPNRYGLINTAGAQGSLILDSHLDSRKKYYKEIYNKIENKNETDTNTKSIQDKAYNDPFDLSRDEDGKELHSNDPKRKNWLGLHYGLTDDQGYFLNYNLLNRSFVIHQYDRYGHSLGDWMYKNRYTLYLDKEEEEEEEEE